MSFDIIQESRNINKEVIGWRRDLHQIPEVGLELPQTVAYVSARLTEMGIEHEIYEDCSCITATIGKGGKCILLRADMDALPVAELTGLDFASTNGKSHACGHDMHAASLLGAAKILKAHEAELNGTVKLIFQSAEEIFKGAAAAINHGLMENPKVDAAFAIHVFAAMDKNVIYYGKEAMAAVYGFSIRVQGKGAHGSAPELGVDPLTAGANILLSLQELLAREIAAKDEASLTIGHFEGGKANNVIPDSCVLEGTLRTFNKDVRAFLINRIHEVAESIAKAYRCSISITEMSSVSAVISDDYMTELVLKCVDELGNGMTTSPTMHLMGSEDFACYCDLVPSMMVILGAGVEDRSLRTGQHSPRILFDEDVLENEVALYVKVAKEYLAENK